MPKPNSGPVERTTAPSADLKAILTAFLAKYDAVIASHEYQGFMAMGWIHGGNYRGENWTAEMDALRAALAALPSAETPTGWRSIESAPKDEQRVLLFNSDESVGGWEVQAGAFYEQLGGWQYDGQSPRYSNAHQPTHWMPLPERPNGDGE